MIHNVRVEQMWEDRDPRHNVEGKARRLIITQVVEAEENFGAGYAVASTVIGRRVGGKSKIKLSRFVPKRYKLVPQTEQVHTVPSAEVHSS